MSCEMKSPDSDGQLTHRETWCGAGYSSGVRRFVGILAPFLQNGLASQFLVNGLRPCKVCDDKGGAVAIHCVRRIRI
jgi:hypothetical protein